jgi:lysophospholipase
MTHAKSLKSKRALTLEKIAAIEAFWQSVEQTSFQTTDDINIAYATNFKRPEKPYIVIVPGRSEAYLKYQELAFDLDMLGFDSVIIDHRGQGLSGRLATNSLQGHVDIFDDYAADLHQLLKQVLPDRYPQHQEGSFMLAHSMGGAIALRYLQLYQHNVKALSLSSPMIAIASAGIPKWLATSLIKTGATLNKCFSATPWYFVGQNDVNETSFADNRLMHSQQRFQRFRDLYHERSELKLGGVTFNWLAQAIKTSESLFIDLKKLSLPIQMLQAGDEYIVDNDAQNNFCQQLNHHNQRYCPEPEPIAIAGAYHELFFEIDQYRDIAINHAITWFSQHQ